MKFLRSVALTFALLLSVSLTDVRGAPVESEDADADDIVVLSALKPAADSGDAQVQVQEPQDSSEEIDYDAWHHGHGDGDGGEKDDSAVIPILTPAKPHEEAEGADGRDVRSADAEEDHYHQDADDDHMDYGHMEPHSDHSLQHDEDQSNSSEESDEMRRKKRSVNDRTAVPNLISAEEMGRTEDDVVVVESCDDSRRVINCGGMSERAESIECAKYLEKCPVEENNGGFVDTFVSCGGFC